jgi:hypothetical protein
MLVLALVVTVTGLLSGGAAGAAATTAAIAGLVIDVFPPTATPDPTTAPTTTREQRTRPSQDTASDTPPTWAPPMTAGTPCRAVAEACLDLSRNLAWLIRGGEVSYGPVPVTHGRPGYPTPPGTFAVTFKNRDHVSSIYDAPMPYAVFFNGGIAFHQGSLRVQSHGCVHLSWNAASTFFSALSRGDIVQVVR